MNSGIKTEILLQTNELQVGYTKSKEDKSILLDNLNLAITPGDLITLIGPNGCGKSTLIKTLAGLLNKLDGEITINGKPDLHLTLPEKSQVMGVVLTDPVYERNMTVFDIVALGRYHYTNWLGKLSDKDFHIIEQAIKQVDLIHKKYSRLNELSDGERQRAMIGKVLAQDANLIILDEPTAHLDLPNRMEMLLLLREISHKSGKGILLSTHELGLALQVSDKVWLVDRRQELVQSLPEDLILSGNLDKTFGNSQIGFHPFSASFELVPNKNFKAQVIGDGLLTACVIHLLKRLRIGLIQNPSKNDMLIEVDEQLKQIHVSYDNKSTFTQMKELQDYLITLFNEQ